jgi:hypothetical protein
MLLKLVLNLMQLIISLNAINGSLMKCNFKSYPMIGCSQESQSICNNKTGICECNRFGYPINFDDFDCLPLSGIDSSCYISEQCIATDPLLKCFYFDSKSSQINNSLIELNKSDSIKLFRLTHKRLSGFCGCDKNYYFDYEMKQCINRNKTKINDPFGLGTNGLHDCSLVDFCNTLDQYSSCDPINKLCVCNEGYIRHNLIDRCVKIKSLYEKCDALDQCIDRNSYCHNEYNLCVCSNGYLPDLQNQLCYKSSSLHEQCKQDRECSFKFGVCHKTKSVCVCDERAIPLSTYNTICVQKTNYGDVCHHEYGDIVCKSSGDHLICNKITNRCVCEDGYLFKGDKCETTSVNRYGIEDDFYESESKKNPMTYIMLTFSSVFVFTILVSIVIKTCRGRHSPRQLVSSNRQTEINVHRDEGSGRPSAPPVYSETADSIHLAFRDRSLTIDSRNIVIDNEDKPPTYEEAIGTAPHVIL